MQKKKKLKRKSRYIISSINYYNAIRDKINQKVFLFEFEQNIHKNKMKIAKCTNCIHKQVKTEQQKMKYTKIQKDNT